MVLNVITLQGVKIIIHTLEVACPPTGRRPWTLALAFLFSGRESELPNFDAYSLSPTINVGDCAVNKLNKLFKLSLHLGNLRTDMKFLNFLSSRTTFTALIYSNHLGKNKLYWFIDLLIKHHLRPNDNLKLFIFV